MQTFEEIANLFKEQSQDISSTQTSKRKILLIDDNREIQNSFFEILKSEYDLISCYNWKDVEDKITQDIDLIILDIKMSDYDGITIFNRVKQKLPNSKIIFNSAYPGDDKEAKKIENLNHNGYLTKGNYSITELKNIIKEILVA